MTSITDSEIKALLQRFYKQIYFAKDNDEEINNIMDRCIKLMEVDYTVAKIDNSNGDLCAQYPSQLLIIEKENKPSCSSGNAAEETTNTDGNTVDLYRIRDQILKAKYSRCRSRFPVATIFYKGKYVCRSATLSGVPEMYGRVGLEYIYLFYGSTTSDTLEGAGEQQETEQAMPELPTFSLSDWELFEKVRNEDIILLKRFNITTIVDLMVEKRKLKYGLYVTSSEKVDTEQRYTNFNLLSMPYPGCEFFKEFLHNSLNARGLVFNWDSEQCDAELSIPDHCQFSELGISWNNYKQWDLIQMTQNYLKHILKYLQEGTSGVLVHCISGWDRTPLYISLLRLSLWADGVIHQGLDEYQILYLTIAYDWMFFGHQLSNRVKKGEEIFLFCFYVLKYLTKKSYAVDCARFAKGKNEQDDEIVIVESETSATTSENDVATNVIESPELKRSLSIDESAPSPQRRRTSPISVPTTDTPSDSECDTGSRDPSHQSDYCDWQVVTDTGSVSDLDLDNPPEDPARSPQVNEKHTPHCVKPHELRHARLTKVRDIFYRLYFHTVGQDIRTGPEESLGAIMYRSTVERVFSRDE